MKTHTVTPFEYGMAERLAVIIESELYPEGGHDKVAFMRGLGQIARSLSNIPGRMGGAMQGLKSRAGAAVQGVGDAMSGAKARFMEGYRPGVTPGAFGVSGAPAAAAPAASAPLAAAGVTPMGGAQAWTSAAPPFKGVGGALEARAATPRPVPGALESRAVTPRGTPTAGDAMNMPPAGAGAASAAAGAGKLQTPRGVNFRAPNAIDQVAAQRAGAGGQAFPQVENPMPGFVPPTPAAGGAGAGGPRPPAGGPAAQSGAHPYFEDVLGSTNPNSYQGALGAYPPTMAAAAADGSKFPLLQRLRQTATENPLRFGAATGLAGAGAVGGLDAYGDHRRREALRQAGFGERLALALKLLSNPDSVANML